MAIRIRPSIVIAVVLAAGATGWILSGQMGGEAPPANAATEAVETEAPPEQKPFGVRVIESRATSHRAVLQLTGRTAADRRVTVRAEAEGRVVELSVDETDAVAKGAEISRVATDDRYARLKEAKALVAQRMIESKAADKLASKGFQSETKRAAAAAALSAAKAQLERIQIEIGKTVTKAPFDAIVQDKQVEIGDYVKVGDPLAILVDLDPIVVEIHVSEREISAVQEGAVAEIVLIGGETVPGVVARIAPAANENTRTFPVEIEVPNPDGSVRDGLTTTVRLPLRETRAHRLSPALLTLDEEGRVGVKTVDETETIVFHPITVVEDAADGMWVAGLPNTARIVAVGQEYVKAGTRVSATAFDQSPSKTD